MRDGVRILNVARGSLIVDEDLKAALDSGKVAGAALDVFRSEPMTDHPLFGYPNVIVTPHLGASTTEATDRAGYQAAEQIVAALQGGSVTTAVNAATIKPEDMEELGPFLPLCRHLGRLGTQLALCGSVDAIEVECLGRIAERDTRPLVTAVLLGVLQGNTEEPINEVNAHAIADERGIRVSETSSTTAHDFTDLVRVNVVCGSGTTTVAGTTIGNRNRPHLLQAWGQRFNLQLEPFLTLFRYEDRPGRHRQGRHVLRRARVQHRLGGGRPCAEQRRPAARGDDHDDRRTGAAAADRRAHRLVGLLPRRPHGRAVLSPRGAAVPRGCVD